MRPHACVIGGLQGHAVFQFNADEVQGCSRLSGEPSAGCHHVCVTCPAHPPNNRVAQRRQDLQDMATSHLGVVCLKGHLPPPMRLVLQLPLAADQGEPTCCISTSRCQARAADHPCLADLPRLCDEALALPLQHLRQPWPSTRAASQGRVCSARCLRGPCPRSRVAAAVRCSPAIGTGVQTISIPSNNCGWFSVTTIPESPPASTICWAICRRVSKASIARIRPSRHQSDYWSCH